MGKHPPTTSPRSPSRGPRKSSHSEDHRNVVYESSSTHVIVRDQARQRVGLVLNFKRNRVWPVETPFSLRCSVTRTKCASDFRADGERQRWQRCNIHVYA
ncbi:hypothetical protein MRX96_044305 [Rhipicephalus microplus]